MDERRARIYEDLSGFLDSELLFEPLERAPYALDASLYEIDPLGVVIPRSIEDLRATVRYAADHGIPLHPRGGGTGLAGESLGPGLVIDFSRHLRRILEIGPDRVRVQPGVVVDVLNTHLAPLGRRLGPDPSGSEACTIGGMVASDTAGSRSLRYGTTSDHVESLEVMFANGETARLGPRPWPTSEEEPADFAGVAARKIASLVRRHSDLIKRSMPKSPRNRAGYRLDRVTRPDGTLDLVPLVVGSEGTLALITEVTLRTVPIPQAQAVVLLPFSRLTEAAAAVSECLHDGPAACDLHDRRSLSLLRDDFPEHAEWIEGAAEAALILEFEGDDPADIQARVRTLIQRLDRRRWLAAAPVESYRRVDCDRLLTLRRRILPHLLRQSGSSRPIPLIEDVAIPPQALPLFLHRIQNILKRHEVNWTLYAHAGDGQLHPRPFLDLARDSDRAKLEPIAAETYEAAWELGGTISGEHGCGLLRSQFLRRQYGELFPVFREVKAAFDPLNLLNPGKVVADDPHLMAKDLRSTLSLDDGRSEGSVEPSQRSGEIIERASLPVIQEGLLRWGEDGLARTISACNGCGACRTQNPALRMCPSFRAFRTEAASPRAQANVLRQIASGRLDPRLWGGEEIRRNAGLCLHCTLCRDECPAGVDVSALMLEAKAAYVQTHGLGMTDWMLARIDRWAGLASRFPGLGNRLLGNASARWLLERLVGLSRSRCLPKAQRPPYLRRAKARGLTQAKPGTPGPRVAYFLDVFANHFDPELAEATVAVLEHCGINVFVPPGQRGSGMAALVVGDLDHARELAARNLRVLGDAVRNGYTIVCSEPTAVLMLTREYLRLTDDLDAELVAANTLEIGQYLAGLEERGQLPGFRAMVPARVGYHQPCHLRTLNVGTPGLDLIRRIPGLSVEFIDRGCSGMAGTFGMSRKNFRTSLRAGRGLMRRLRDHDLEIGSTECAACRLQMEQGITKRTIHPMKLLSLAYGLDPKLKRHLQGPKSRHEIA